MPIRSRPSDLKRYVEERISTLERLTADLKVVAERAVAATPDGYSMLSMFLKYGNVPSDVAVNVSGLDHFANRLDDRLALSDLLHNLRAVMQHGGTFWQYVAGAFRYREPLDPMWNDLLSGMDAARAGAEAYGYDPDAPESAADEEFVAAFELHSCALELREILAEAEPLASEIVDMGQLMLEIRAANASGRSWRPDHAAVETLWHATAFAPELASDGFFDAPPQDRRGLGDFGANRNRVSFTHDKSLADGLVRCLDELWQIANDELTVDDILAWIDAEGLDRSEFSRMTGINRPVETMSGRADAANLYHHYLSLSNARENPVFVHIERATEALRGRPRASIGVIECEVELTEADEYLISMSEFRVEPTSVLAVRHEGLEWRRPAVAAYGRRL